MQVRIDRHNPGELGAKNAANDLLSDGFSRPKGTILAHIRQVGGHKSWAFKVVGAQYRNRQQKLDQLVIRLVERPIDDGVASYHVQPDAAFAVRESMAFDGMTGNSKFCGERRSGRPTFSETIDGF